MKLIEKLAKEAGTHFKAPIPPNSNAVMPFDAVWKEAFEAGFRKACDLSLECVRNGDHIPNDHYTRDIEEAIQALPTIEESAHPAS